MCVEGALRCHFTGKSVRAYDNDVANDQSGERDADGFHHALIVAENAASRYKNAPREERVSDSDWGTFVGSALAGRHEAVLAQDRLAALFDGARLERDLALRAALGAHCIVHLTILTLVLAVRAAILAALGSAQVARSVELLFTGTEGERGATVAADDLLIARATLATLRVFVHKEKRKKK